MTEVIIWWPHNDWFTIIGQEFCALSYHSIDIILKEFLINFFWKHFKIRFFIKFSWRLISITNDVLVFSSSRFFFLRSFLMRFYCIFKNWNGSRANHEEEKSIVYDGCYTSSQKLPHNYPEFALMVENRMLSSLLQLMAICWDTSEMPLRDSLSPKICKPQFVFPEEFWCGEMIIVISGFDSQCH